MASWLAIAGDVLWILAMSIIASTSRGAIARIPPEVSAPMQWGPGRRPLWRLPRNAAFTLMIGAPTVVGLVMLVVARIPPTPNAQLLIFCLRALMASTMALIHIGWLRGVLRTLGDEGVLKG